MEEEKTEKINETTLVEWRAEEFNNYSHNWIWYLLVIFITLIVIAYSVYSRDWFIIGVAVILNIFIFWYIRKKPDEINYRITQLGIYNGERFYPYSEIHSYWISYNKEGSKLNIVFTKKYLPLFSFHLKDVDPLIIKSVLSKHIPEQENRNESLMEWLSRILKI